MSMPPDPARPTEWDPTTPPCPASSTADVVIRWVGWHLGELTGVGVPLVLAVTVSVWLALIGVLIGALWAMHEIRVSRRHRALPAATPHGHRPTPTTTTTNRKAARA
jgi:hypothetical protein